MQLLDEPSLKHDSYDTVDRLFWRFAKISHIKYLFRAEIICLRKVAIWHYRDEVIYYDLNIFVKTQNYQCIVWY